MSEEIPVRAGVIGVGTMGKNHARVYRELAETELCGVFDADEERAAEVADSYGTRVLSMADLLDEADVVSVAVPTQYHYETVRECVDAGVHVLVEKPFVDDIEKGRTLIDFAEDRGVMLQVGHIERFNPATQKLLEIAGDLDIIAADIRRLSPPLEREIDDSAVMDLMIHDVDIITALVGEEVTAVEAMGTEDVRYAAANIQFESGVVGQLTASRVTQEKERVLTLSARSCRVKVNFIDQSIEIHRQSLPEYVEENGNVTYHHENVVETVRVEKREPLKNELASFVEAAVRGTEPVVTAEDGLRALELTQRIDELAARSLRKRPPTPAR